MADIDIRRRHDLGLEGARAAADRMAGELARRFDLRGTWDGNAMRFERPGLKGTLQVSADSLHLTVTLGFLLKAMRGQIERAVTTQLDDIVRGEDSRPRKA